MSVDSLFIPSVGEAYRNILEAFVNRETVAGFTC